MITKDQWINNTVICTAVTGGYDYLIDSIEIEGVDYIYFTDGQSPFPIQSPWTPMLLGDELLDNRRRSKRPKLNPHSIEILNNYKYLIWIDGDMGIVNPNFVEEIFSYMKNGFVISPHFDMRHCAYGEATIRPPKYAKEPLDEQCDFYRSEGFPENYGLYECGVSLRDMTNPIVKELGELWYDQNMTWSYQDQVSLPYCLWKMQYTPDILPASWRSMNWIYLSAHMNPD